MYTDDDGNIPHFHVYDINKKLDTCIEISRNKYFLHGKHQGIITSSKIRKMLYDFLRSRPKSFQRRSYDNNWQWIKEIWNSSDHRMKVPDDITEPPDYTNITLN